MQMPFAGSGPNRNRAAWWWSDPELWEFLPNGEVRLYLPWGQEFGCLRWTGAAWTEDVPADLPFDRRGTWKDPEGLRDDAWQAACAARAAYFSAIPWAVRAEAARRTDPWRFLLEEAARRFGSAAAPCERSSAAMARLAAAWSDRRS